MSLRDEILSGPLAAELAPFVTAGADAIVAAVLNRPDAGTRALPVLDVSIVLDAIDPGELGKLDAGNMALLNLAVASGSVSRKVWEAAFPAGVSRAALDQAGSVPASAAQLAGFGTVTHLDVAAAFRQDRDGDEVKALGQRLGLTQKEIDALPKDPTAAAQELLKLGKMTREPPTKVDAALAVAVAAVP